MAERVVDASEGETIYGSKIVCSAFDSLVRGRFAGGLCRVDSAQPDSAHSDLTVRSDSDYTELEDEKMQGRI